MPREAAWRKDLTTMPKKGHFEVMQIKEVFRDQPDKLLVIDPVAGRVFVPVAWRPLNKAKRNARTNRQAS